jgi:hypothetical protein
MTASTAHAVRCMVMMTLDQSTIVPTVTATAPSKMAIQIETACNIRAA